MPSQHGTLLAFALIVATAARSATASTVAQIPLPNQEAYILGQQQVAPNGGMSPPRAVQYSKPVYTEEALERGIEGVVTFLAEFDIDGNFKILRMEKGLGFGLNEAALDAILKWQFAPAYRSGRRVNVIARVDVPFSLPERSLWVELQKAEKLLAESLKKLRDAIERGQRPQSVEELRQRLRLTQ